MLGAVLGYLDGHVGGIDNVLAHALDVMLGHRTGLRDATGDIVDINGGENRTYPFTDLLQPTRLLFQFPDSPWICRASVNTKLAFPEYPQLFQKGFDNIYTPCIVKICL